MSALQKRIVLFLTMALMVWTSSAVSEIQPQDQTTFTTSVTTCAESPNQGWGAIAVGGFGSSEGRTKYYESYFGEFPWTVALLHANDLSYFCAGSLIHPQVVLTAASCLLNLGLSDFVVRAGEWNSRTNTESLKHEDRIPRQMSIHKNFNKKTKINDFALILLNEAVPMTEHIQTVCLAPANFVTKPGQICYSGGWGKDKFGEHSAILKGVKLSSVPFGQCQQAFRSSGSESNFILDQSFVCAVSGKNGDVCDGDEGAPLVCPVDRSRPHTYYQTGIVAWGLGCDNGVPGAFASVSYGRTWIDQQMAKFGLGTATYTAQ